MTEVEPMGSQVSLLHRISNIVSSGLELETMLNDLVGLIMQVADSDACLVYLADHARGDVVLRASQLPHSKEIGHIRLKMGEGITGWVAVHKSVVALARDAWADNRFKAFQALPEDSYAAFLSVPLVSGGDLIGVINVHHREPHQHTAEEVALVTFIGEQMGGALAKSRLTEESQSAAKRMETLAAVAQTISEESDPEQVLPRISRMVAETLEAPGCSIVLSDAPGSPNGLSVPLTSRDKALGAISIEARPGRPFSDEEIGFVKAVAGQAAIAIENARLTIETLDMKRALETRKIVERAKGILQHRHSLTEEEAYLRLRNESRRLRRPMRDLAEAVILSNDLTPM
ncbi:MAG: GAF domain-containing protein [Acidobacteriota bacterium]|nr:GAF domain-containing protein [Acidobacteriota bacterium]